MQLMQKQIQVNTTPLQPASFLIERFEVPAELTSLVFKLEVPEFPIEVMLVYDSMFNLRAEYRDMCSKTRFVISQEEMLSSEGTKCGHIHQGEWIIALQLAHPNMGKPWHCTYTIEGYQDELLF